MGAQLSAEIRVATAAVPSLPLVPCAIGSGRAL